MASKIIDVHPHIISNDDQKYPITPLGGTCGSCHGKYRDRMDDGTFRLKTGSY